jgi:phosphatidylglycerophosphatase C
VTAATAPRLAVFDLDGTLTRRDSFVEFVWAALARWPGRSWRVPLLLGPLLGFALRRLDRGALKGAILHRLFAGISRSEMERLTATFARGVVARSLHSEALGVIARHRAAGDRLVLMSASPDLYVPRIADELGFDEASCSAVRWDGDELDGRLSGPNCRGAEKTRRLRELRAAHAGWPAIAYGNSESDVEHMRLCERSVYVNARGHHRTRLEAAGITVVDWH